VIPRTKAELFEHNLSNRIIMGYNDHLQLGVGWHALEYSPPQPSRWTRKIALAYLTPLTADRRLVFYVKLATIVGIINSITHRRTTEKEMNLRVTINGKRLLDISAVNDQLHYLLVEFDRRLLKRSRVFEVALESDRTIVPNDYLGNGDLRDVAFRIGSLGLENWMMLRAIQTMENRKLRKLENHLYMMS
jgi:hypothetical protein